MARSIAIIDYGTGNIASLEMALIVLGVQTALARHPCDLANIDAVILPGVGHFGPASASLVRSGLAPELRQRVAAGMPALGICLGFQLLTAASDEASDAAGLALLPLVTQRLRPQNTSMHKVPHLGWNILEPTSCNSRLLDGITPEQQRFYFANAYAIHPDPQLPAIQAIYHHESPWLALVEHGPICGVQFHPEKSRSQGLQLLRNFLALAAEYR